MKKAKEYQKTMYYLYEVEVVSPEGSTEFFSRWAASTESALSLFQQDLTGYKIKSIRQIIGSAKDETSVVY